MCNFPFKNIKQNKVTSAPIKVNRKPQVNWLNQYIIVKTNSLGIIESICRLRLGVYIGFKSLLKKRLSKKFIILKEELYCKKNGNDNKKESLREMK